MGLGDAGSAILCELTREFHPVPSPPCVAEDSRSGEGFQVCHLQMTSISFPQRARWCGQKEVPDQLAIMKSRNVAKPSLDELRRYTPETEVDSNHCLVGKGLAWGNLCLRDEAIQERALPTCSVPPLFISSLPCLVLGFPKKMTAHAFAYVKLAA